VRVMTSRLRSLLSRRGPLEPLYGPGEDGALEENPHWQVGARYEVLRAVAIHERPDVTSPQKGALKPATSALIMAMSTFPSAGGDEVLMGFLADTRSPIWLAGWALLGPAGVSSPQQLEDPPIDGVRLKGSWEFGGRYRVKDKLTLRDSVELPNDSQGVICDLQKYEEVLVVELGLVFLDGEPRLRARVRADSGAIGWLTVERPDKPPLLDPLNLYSAAAIRPGLFKRSACRAPLVPRTTVSGMIEAKAWEVGGRYRTLAKTTLRASLELDSPLIAKLQRGSLVTVQDSKVVQWHPQVPESLRLKVAIDRPGLTPQVGWISAANSKGETVLDVRDQLEFTKYLISQGLLDCDESELFTVHLRRPQPGCSLGVAVDHSDGRTLLINDVTASGLIADWNVRSRSTSEVQICVGDRIVYVNGRCGSAAALLEEMGKDDLELKLYRHPSVEVHPTLAASENAQGIAEEGEDGADREPRDGRAIPSTSHGRGRRWSSSFSQDRLGESEASDASSTRRWEGGSPRFGDDTDDPPHTGEGDEPHEDVDCELDMPTARLRRSSAGDASVASPATGAPHEEWKPMGICPEEAPDCQPFEHPPVDREDDSDCRCRCRESDGFLATLLCGAGGMGCGRCGGHVPPPKPPQPRGWPHLKASGACAAEAGAAIAALPSMGPNVSAVRR